MHAHSPSSASFLPWSPARRLLVLCGLLAIGIAALFRQWQGTPARPMAARPPVAGNANEVTRGEGRESSGGRRTSAPGLRRYLEAADNLRAHAVSAGSVSYADVLQRAYPEGMITPQVLARKAMYRRRLDTRYPFLANYALMHSPAHVREVDSLRELQFYEPASGAYFPGSNLIGLVRRGPGTTLYHEAGHALQREDPSPVVFEDIVAAARHEERISAAESSRVQYLTSLKELEISLQDLNRYYANFIAGRPILTPEDSLHALLALGVVATWEEVEQAFAGEKVAITRERHLEIRSRPQSSIPFHLACPSARRLVTTLTIARKTDPAVHSGLLRYLIFAAPGHV